MKIRILLAGSSFLLLAACSLAGDVTPPPALATQQAVEVPAATTLQEAQPPGASGVQTASPVPPEANPSLMNGALIYVDRCAPCHGEDGLGQGSMAANLEVPPSPLGDLEFSRSAQPADWYTVVTEGRMDRFMPPFASLSDVQRWDVVAYALSLSTTNAQLARGEELFDQACVGCHGASGTGGQAAVDLTAPDFYARQSLEALSTTIAGGGGGMPAFADTFDSEQLLSLAAYVRSLAFSGHSGPGASAGGEGNPPSAGEEGAAAAESAAALGTIEGQIVNGTPGGDSPGALDVSIIGFDGDQPVYSQDVTADSDGRYSLENVEIVAGRIFGAIVEYKGVPYYSSAGHLLESEPTLQLPLTVFETTPNIDTVQIDRLHLIFDFSVQGQVEVSQLWLISNRGDRTVAGEGGENAIPVELPEGAQNLRFADQAADALYTPTANGFVMHEPVRPDDALELIFSFTLPYNRRLDYEQTMTLPVGAVVLLTDQNAPEISGEGVTASGEQAMGEITLKTYQRPGLAKGEVLQLTLSGSQAGSTSGSTNTNLVIGIGALAFALIVVGIGLRQLRRQEPPGPEREMSEDTALNRDELIQAIAALDTAFEAGKIEQTAYQERRASFKRELMKVMSEAHD